MWAHGRLETEAEMKKKLAGGFFGGFGGYEIGVGWILFF